MVESVSCKKGTLFMFITRCITISVILIGVASTPLSAAAPLRSLQVQFYDQSIVLDFDKLQHLLLNDQQLNQQILQPLLFPLR